MKHIIEYSLYEGEISPKGDIAHKVYRALLDISGLPQIFKGQMLLGKGTAFAIMNGIPYEGFKGSIGSNSPISKADYEEAQRLYNEECRHYIDNFERGWGARNPDGEEDPETGDIRITSHMKSIIPYQKLLSLLATLEGEALKRGDIEIKNADLLSYSADYTLNHQPIETELLSGDIGKAMEKILLALGFDRGDLPGMRGEWEKIK